MPEPESNFLPWEFRDVAKLIRKYGYNPAKLASIFHDNLDIVLAALDAAGEPI